MLCVVEGKMDGAKYRTILEENLLESAKDLRLGWSFTFQQDNEPKHTVRAIMEWFRSKNMHVLEWHKYFSLYMCIAGRDPKNLAAVISVKRSSTNY